MSGTSLCPDQPSEPQAHSNWVQNDERACALIYDTIEPSERLAVGKFPKGAKDFWKALQQRHKKAGPVSQVYLIKDALGKRASVGDEGMAGKTITESKAQRMKDREAKNPKPTTSTSTTPTMITRTVKDESTGAMYLVCMPEDAKPVQTHALIGVSSQTHMCTDNIDTMVYSTDDLERGEAVWGYSSAFMAIAGTTGTSPPPHPDHTNLPPAEHIRDWSTDNRCFRASVNWNIASRQVDIAAIVIEPLHQSQSTPISTDTCPFYVDTGATAHISPDRTDFITLRPISAHTIKGVGGSFITAIANSANAQEDAAIKELCDAFNKIGIDAHQNLGSEEIKDRILAAITEHTIINPRNVEFADDPKDWHEAQSSPHASQWEAAYHDELKSLKDCGVYTLVPRQSVPTGTKVRKCRPIFKIKRNEDGQIDRFKIDVKTAFLYGLLPDDETQYMEQPEGFEEPEKKDWVWKLQRGLYGMKQSGRIWNQTMNDAMIGWGFTKLTSEPCIYYRKTDTDSTCENDTFEIQMQGLWEISSRPVKFCTALIDKVVSQFGQSDAHPISTPMDPGLKLCRPDPKDITPTERTQLNKLPYRSLVGCLIYLAIGTRPDISYAVQQLSQFLNCYTYAHWTAATRVVRYLKGTRSLALRLGGKGSIRLLGFTDSDWANCLDTRRSVGGYGFTLGSGVISWTSKKQSTIATSTCQAEYMAAFDASKEAMFLRNLLSEVNFAPNQPTTILCDNNAAIIISEDPLHHNRTKHFDIRYHYLREHVQTHDISLAYINTKDNLADIFTKALPTQQFIRLRSFLGLV
ncbi:unnamed protein product [Cyclocybe aegerita]|uniref:Reverse transcriptase Ty1/copia-type domain-containing protein n=1 Tax=Cyclocybe aegerita TaxID=1973307 RepID=A0A8S0VSV7_CYCAE|nr:unnamed protein product [Cyclocybe aegerita]